MPSLIVPFGADQPFWGRQVTQLGVGPQPIPMRQLTADRLAAAIRVMDDPGIRARAAAIESQLRQEDGVRAAIDVIERVYEGKGLYEYRHAT